MEGHEMSNNTKKIAIIIVPNKSEDAEVIVPADVWTRAGYLVDVITLGKVQPTKLGRYITIVPQLSLECEEVDLASYDVFFLPGGDVVESLLTGAPKLEKHLKGLLGGSATPIIAAICAAPAVLGKWGLLDGREYTSYPGVEIAGTGTRVEQSAVIDLGIALGGTTIANSTNPASSSAQSAHPRATYPLITGRGPGASFDLALAVVEVIDGTTKACELSQSLQYQVAK